MLLAWRSRRIKNWIDITTGMGIDDSVRECGEHFHRCRDAERRRLVFRRLNTHYNFCRGWYCLFSWRHAAMRSFIDPRYETTRGYLILADTARRFSQKRLYATINAARPGMEFRVRKSCFFVRQPATFLLMCIKCVLLLKNRVRSTRGR